MRRYNKGFTLLELLVTLAIISILMMMGVSSFQNTIRGSRLTAFINELSATMNLARSEAIKRNKNVVVCKANIPVGSAVGSCVVTAGTKNWESGWLVFVDVDRSTGYDNIFNDDGDATLCEATEDCLLKVQEALPVRPDGTPIFTLRPTGSAFNNYVRYTPTGASSTGSASFYLCDTNSYSPTSLSSSTFIPYTAKVLIFNAVGRPQMAVDPNKTGIPKVSGNDITACTPP